jgi:serine kinase of HPr protein (carbohydrate metabolism regulator)
MSETLHGTAVLAGSNGVLIRGASGAGKSRLAFALIERGARLVADDRVHVSACHGRLVATGPDAIAGRLELRGRGIIAVPHEQSAVIRLVVDLVEEAELERLPEAAELSATLLGVALPRQPVPAASGDALMLVQAALRALPPHCNMGLR